MKNRFRFIRSPSRRQASPGEADAGAPDARDPGRADRRFQAFSEPLEAQFQADTAEDQIRALHRAALSSALIYVVQLFPEWSLTRDAFTFACALHFGLVTPALLLIAAFARFADTPLRRDLMGLAIPALIAGQVAATYFASATPEAPSYLSLLAVIAIVSNASLPLSSRASIWATTLCMTLLALSARAPHPGLTQASIGELMPVSLGALMTLHSAVQRNREARRVYLLDQRQRLRVAEIGMEARHDPLTGLANRRLLEEAAEAIWANPTGHVSPISVIIYDVDRFKSYNDLYGHLAGDDCLRKVAACALAEIGANDDVAARYGGEEFILLLPRTPLEEARRAAERLRAAVAALRIPHAGGEELGVVTASFGVASADTAARSFADLTAEADAALYRAKHAGRNRVLAAAPGAPSRGPKAA